VQASADGRTLGVTVADGATALEEVLAEVRGARIALHDIGMERPTLDDVFLGLTGHASAPDADHALQTSEKETR
jgi:ABC-2 type transport system ATP-binding protein